MTTQADDPIAAIKARLESSGLGYHDINVFGVLRINVHVRCLGSETAHKWQRLLCSAFPGARPSLTATRWDAAKNKNNCLCPTKRRGYLIAVAA